MPQQGIHKLVYDININITGKYGHKGALIKRGCIATIDIYTTQHINWGLEDLLEGTKHFLSSTKETKKTQKIKWHMNADT